MSLIGVVVGLILALIVYYVLTVIRAPQVLAALVAVLVFLIAALGGVTV